MPSPHRIESQDVAIVVSPTTRGRPSRTVSESESESSNDGSAAGGPASCQCKSSPWRGNAVDSVDYHVHVPQDGLRIAEHHQDIFAQWDALHQREGEAAYAVSGRDVSGLENQRGTLSQWIFQVTDHYDIDRVVGCVALSHFDRLVSTGLVENANKELRSAVMACLYVAAKTHSSSRSIFTAKQMAELSYGKLGEEEIVDMEHHILNAFEFRMHPPLPTHFVHILQPMLLTEPMGAHDLDLQGYITFDAEARYAVVEQAMFLCEAASVDVFFCDKIPSSVAYAALRVAFPDQASEWFHSLPLECDAKEVKACIDRFRAYHWEGEHQSSCTFEYASDKGKKTEEKERPRTVTPTKDEVPSSIKRLRQEAVVDSLIDSYVGSSSPTKKARTV